MTGRPSSFMALQETSVRTLRIVVNSVKLRLPHDLPMALQPARIREPSGAALRKLILQTSRQLLLRDGYRNLSMRKIARSMGYSATTIYLHFQSKDQLIHALIDDGIALLGARLRPMMEAGSHSPESTVESICREYVAFGLEQPGYYEIIYLLHPENLSVYPGERYKLARGLIEDVAGVIQSGVEMGVFYTRDTVFSANILWSQMHGLVSLILAGRFDNALETRQLVDAAVHASINGLISKRPVDH